MISSQALSSLISHYATCMSVCMPNFHKIPFYLHALGMTCIYLNLNTAYDN